MTRLKLKIEMWDYSFNHSGVVNKLEDLVMESGGAPVISIIVSTWGSGTSFLSEFINTVPGSFYSHEPLRMFGRYSQIRGPPQADKANMFLKNLLKCNYNNGDLKQYMEFDKHDRKTANAFGRYHKFWTNCNYNQTLCYDANFTSKMCKLFPFQNMKLVRFRLHLFEDILEDKELNVKVALLIRDPRDVMLSRRLIKKLCFVGNKTVPDCAEASSLCTDMITDYEAAAYFLQKYPDILMILRYEDLVFNLNATIVELAKFLWFEPAKWVNNFLRTHDAAAETRQNSSLLKDVMKKPFIWKKKMKFEDVKEIQEKCKGVMSLWGYELAHNASQLTSKDFNPLLLYSIK